jgi:hypothetical protein
MLTEHYSTLLAIHGILRWFVLIAGVATLIGCLIGILHKLPFKPLGRILGLIYVSLLDTQFLIGILLSIASPIVQAVWSNPAIGMKSHDLRFFAIEHSSAMLIALAIAHIGAVKSRRAVTAVAAYKKALIWYAISLVIILGMIPWWRPLLRL